MTDASSNSPHAPVLLAEVIVALAPATGDVVIDATFGAGGYTRAILKTGAQVVALDRDQTVQPHADAVASDFPGQFQLIRTPFSGLAQAFADSGKARLDGAVFDIGVSSMQLDQAERGFSFMRDGPLDMRMSDEGETAADIVNGWDHGPLAHIFKLYGEDARTPGTYAFNCLMARRLAERDVRFIQLYHRGWDHHGGLVKYMNTCCGLTDKPTWALIQDLKQRDMLDDTLVIWGGEFGRTPMFQGKGGAGRDHHVKGFSMWMAGGGIKGGVGYGETDELGYHAEKNIVHVRDLHATMLHQLGIDHERFSVKHQGLDMRLSGVEKARVVKDILI